MCDNEHMFACPGSTDENELETLARSIQNEGLMDSTMDKILENMHTPPNHKVVAKKFFIKRVSCNSFYMKHVIPSLYFTTVGQCTTEKGGKTISGCWSDQGLEKGKVKQIGKF